MDDLDDANVIKDPLALSVRLAREERLYMSRWLALEVLITDEAVCEDAELFDRLSKLQEKFEQQTLAKYGAA
jgi:hypothetical protein